MKLVKFNRDMAPHRRGDEKVFPDDTAAVIVENGDGDVIPSPFDRAAAAQPATKPKRNRPHV